MIRGANAEAPVGRSEQDNLNLRLYAGSYLRSAQDVEGLVVGVNNGRPVYVRDVARVTETVEDAENYVNYYTGPAYAAANQRERLAEGEQAVTYQAVDGEAEEGRGERAQDRCQA